MRVALALVALVVMVTPSASLAEPMLTLSPDRASCTSSVTLTGRDLPPGQGVALAVRQIAPVSDHGGGGLSPTTVANDGTLRLTLPVAQLVRDCASSSPPAPGTRYVVHVTPDGKNPDSRVFASAEFTLTGPGTPGLPNTGGGAATRPAPSGAVAPLAMLALVLTGLRLACLRRRSTTRPG